jgi:hypothetical protein
MSNNIQIYETSSEYSYNPEVFFNKNYACT